jgi:hypothetical protein
VVCWLDTRRLSPCWGSTRFDARSISFVRGNFRFRFELPLAMWRRNYQPLPQDKSEQYLNDSERWDPSTFFILVVWHEVPS